MTIQIQHRRGTAAEWTAANPTLAAGEMGVEIDTLKVKMGNGTTAWTSLPYFTQGAKGDTGATGNTGPTGATGPTGPRGLTGPANSLTVGSVAGGAAGSTPVVEITGDAPNQSVAFTIPKGDKGDAATVAVGTTSATAAGTSPTVTNSGTSGAAVLDFTIPNGVGVPTGGTTGQIIRKTASATEWADNKLNDLKDVTLTSPATGQGLTYDGAKWVNATPVSALSGLSDVTVTSPADKQVLQYETSSGKWKNKQATGGVSVSDTTPASPIDGDALFYSADGTMFVRYNDGTSVQWVQPNAVLSSQIEQRYYSPNYVINGAFDIWQRGSSFGAVNAYTADRWYSEGNSSTVQGTLGGSDVSPVPGISNFARISRTSNLSTYPSLAQRIEDVNNFAGQTVTISFYARQNTAFSAGNWQFMYGQFFGTGGSTAVANYTAGVFAPTSSWQRFSLTIAVPSVAGKTIGAGNFFLAGIRNDSPTMTTGQLDVTGFQVESGSTATAFRRNANSVQGELDACMRYFQNIPSPPLRGMGSGAATVARLSMPLAVVMRATPSFTFTGSNPLYDGATGASVTGIINNWCTTSSIELDITSSYSFGAGRSVGIYNASTGGCQLSAEL